jgi:hypothetical protein
LDGDEIIKALRSNNNFRQLNKATKEAIEKNTLMGASRWYQSTPAKAAGYATAFVFTVALSLIPWVIDRKMPVAPPGTPGGPGGPPGEDTAGENVDPMDDPLGYLCNFNPTCIKVVPWFFFVSCWCCICACCLILISSMGGKKGGSSINVVNM